MSWSILHQQLKDKLDIYVGDGKLLVGAFKSHNVRAPGYPFATVQPSSKEEDFYTTSNNLSKYVFEIVVHQEMEQVGSERAIEIVSKVLDVIERDIREDYMLGGTVHLMRPVPAEWGEYPEESGMVQYGSLRVIIEKQH